MACLGLKNWLAVLVCAPLAVGCSNSEELHGPTQVEPVGQLAQPLTSNELAMLGFETMTWAPIWNPATLAQSTLHTRRSPATETPSASSATTSASTRGGSATPGSTSMRLRGVSTRSLLERSL